jgi:hypothetical protein
VIVAAAKALSYQAISQSEEGLHTGQPANAPERAASKSSDA